MTDTKAPGPTPIGRYELLHEIATGGMATVHLARVRGVAGFERIVALKCCHPHLRREQEFTDMFLDEARLAARIHHPNVVATLDVGEAENGALYLVMDLVDGFSLGKLHARIRSEGTAIPAPIALRIMSDALAGLHAAHELCDANGKPLNLVHRDISPQNILVGSDGLTRITDFGVAKAEERLSTTREGHLKGKLSYMAPEQIGLHPVITRQADLYAAGVVLWEMLTGERLFDGKSDVETLNLVLRGSVRRPSEICEGIGPDLDAVVMRALARDSAQRFESALEFADALENLSIRLATARAVGAFVQDVLAESFKRRRDLLRRCAEAAPVVIERPTAPAPESEFEAAKKTTLRGAARVTRVSRPPTRKANTKLYAIISSVLAVGAVSIGFAVHQAPTARTNAALSSPFSVSPLVRARPAASIQTDLATSVSSEDAGALDAMTESRDEQQVRVESNPLERDAGVAPASMSSPSDAEVHHTHHLRSAPDEETHPLRFMPHSI